MKRKILICSIFRNRDKFVERWYDQINSIAKYYKDEYDFTVSIYENDSIDNTKDKLLLLKNNNFKNLFLTMEDIKTNYYPSIVNQDRVKNLANARNHCLNIKDLDLSKFYKIIFIEPDFQYELSSAIKIISAEKINNIKFDIISGISIFNGIFYDFWATRKTENDTQTKIDISNTVEPFWSTFNGFCSYNPEAFHKGLRFRWFNDRLDTFDCDTAVICEDFRKNKYDKIYIDRSAIFNHEE
jgi:hypothetical protein